MVADVAKNRLLGQYLNRRTGTAIRSFPPSIRVEILDELIRGVWGSNVEYVRVHEEGFDGSVQVPAHTRRLIEQVRSKAAARRVRRKLRAGRKRFAHVRAHRRRVSFRARRFMAHTARDKGPEANRRVIRAIIHLVRTGEVPTLADVGGA